MKHRQVHKHPIRMPKGIPMPDCAALSMENVYHTPGQTAAIRFVNQDSEDDLQAMRDILKGKQVRRWMDDANRLTKSDFQDWAGTHTIASFLYAVLDARMSEMTEMEKIRGFVYLYSEREEKFRVKRMEKLGLLKPATGLRHCLEISFALRPLTDGSQAGSGIMSSAVRQACLQTQMLLQSNNKAEVVIFAFTDPLNFSAQRTIESAGFEKRGSMKYDRDAEEETFLYILNWRTLQQKIKQKMLELQVSAQPILSL